MNRTLLYVAFFFLLEILLAVLNPYNFYIISLKTVFIYSLFILLLFCYAIFYNSPINNRVSFIFRKQIVLFINLYFALGVLLFLTHLYIKSTYELSSQQLRDLYFFGQESGELTIFNYFFIPMSIINGFGLFVFLVLLVSLKNRIENYNVVLFVKCLAAMLLINTAESGRMAFFVLGILIVIFFMKYQTLLKKLRRTWWGLNVTLISLALVGYITVTRLGDFSIMKFLYTYVVGPVFLFDYALNDQAGIIYNPENRFGFSFMSLDWLLTGIYNVFSSEHLNSLFSISDPFLTYGYEMNDQMSVNAFFTFFTFFYIDYGILAPFFVVCYHFIIIGFGRLIKARNIVELDILMTFFLVYGALLNMLSSPMYLVTLLSLFFINPYKRIE